MALKKKIDLTPVLRSPQQQHDCESQVPDIWDEDEWLRTCLHLQQQHQRLYAKNIIVATAGNVLLYILNQEWGVKWLDQ